MDDFGDSIDGPPLWAGDASTSGSVMRTWSTPVALEEAAEGTTNGCEAVGEDALVRACPCGCQCPSSVSAGGDSETASPSPPSAVELSASACCCWCCWAAAVFRMASGWTGMADGWSETTCATSS